MKTGSKKVGWALAAAIAVPAADAGAPAATSAERSEAAFLIRAPSTPMVTASPWLVSGVPPAPRMPARAGQAVARVSLPPVRSCGTIVAGDHFTSHFPFSSTRCREDLRVMAPRPASVSRSVTGSLAADPLVVIVPAVKLACRTLRRSNATWFTGVKSAGGSLASCRIAAQSCLPHAARKALAVGCGTGGELLHPLSKAPPSAVTSKADSR